MRKVVMSIMFISVVFASNAFAASGKMTMKKFEGTWGVDFERTMEEGKKSPKYKPEDAERMPAMIKGMMSKMKIKVTAENMVYVMGAKEMSISYKVISSD